MDPSVISLTTSQKTKALAKAVHSEIDWENVIPVVVITVLGLIIGNQFPSFPLPWYGDFIIRRIILGGIAGTVAAIGICVCFVFCGNMYDKVRPFLRKVNERYDEEKYKIQKDVLDNVVEDEILNK